MQIAVKKRCNNRASTAWAHSSGSLSFYHLLSHIKHLEYTHLCLLLLPLFPPLILNSLVSLLLVEEYICLYIYIYRKLREICKDVFQENSRGKWLASSLSMEYRPTAFWWALQRQWFGGLNWIGSGWI